MRYLLRTLRFCQIAIGLLLELFVVAFFAIQFPAAQNAILPWLRGFLSQQVGGEVYVRRIEIGFPDRFILEDVSLCGPGEEQPAIRLKELHIGFLSFRASEFLFADATTRRVGVRLVRLVEPEVRLITHPDGRSNLDFLSAGADTTKPDTSRPKKLILNIGEVDIRRLSLRLIDSTSNTAPRPGMLNFSNLDVAGLNLNTSFRLLGPGRLEAEIKRLNLSEKVSGMQLHHLSTRLSANLAVPYVARVPDSLRNIAVVPPDSMPYVRLMGTSVRLARADLEFDADLRNETFADIFNSEAPHRRWYYFDFRDSQVDFDAITYFLEEPLPVEGLVQLHGKITGDVRRIKGEGLRLAMGRYSWLSGDLRMNDYTKRDFFLEVNIDSSNVHVQDLRPLLPDVDFPTELDRVGVARLTGKYEGFGRDMVILTRVETDFGTAYANLNLKFPRGEASRYAGTIRGRMVNLDQLLDLSVSQSLNVDVNVRGTGFSPRTATADFDIKGWDSWFFGHAIDSLAGKVRVSDQNLSGRLAVDDREGSLLGNFAVHLDTRRPAYSFEGRLDQIDLRHYGLARDSVRLSTALTLALAGDSVESMSGLVEGSNIRVKNLTKRRERVITDILLTVKATEDRRKSVTLQSELLDASVAGIFRYDQMGPLFSRLGKETTLFLENDTAAIRVYYEQKREPNPDSLVSGNFELNVKRLREVSDFINFPLQAAEGGHIDGTFAFGETDRLLLNWNLPDISYDDIRGQNVVGRFSLDKSSLSNALRAQSYLQLDHLFIGSGFVLDDITFLPSIQNRFIGFQLAATQDSARKQLRLTGEATYREGVFDGHLVADSSGLLLRDALWSFDRENRIVYGAGRLEMENFRLVNGQQSIVVESDIRPGRQEGRLDLTLRSLDVAQLADLLLPGYRLEGVLSGNLTVRDLFGKPEWIANGSLRRFRYENVRYGDIFLQSDWDEHRQSMAMNVSLVQQADTLLGLKGYYTPGNKRSPLDFVLATTNLPVNLAEPFVGHILYDIKGFVQIERLNVTGTLDAPRIKGDGYLKDVSFGTYYFKTTYRLDGVIDFDEKAIRLPNFTVRDAQGGSARITGNIFHEGFTQVRLDLRFDDFRNFLFMDTQAGDNDLFYGRVVLRNGSGSIRGPFLKPMVRASITTGAGTRFFIPITSYTEQSRLPFVVFRQRDSEVQVKGSSVDLEGVDLALNVEATADAELSLILDEKTGDYIRGAGIGTLAVNITTDGEFTLDGQYELVRGNYFLSAAGVIKRNFDLVQPSAISWTGDPYDGQLDIQAKYTVQASLGALDSAAANVYQPVDILLFVKGSLLQPEVSFRLELPTSTSGSLSTISSRLALIQSDPQALNRQVFSLLTLRRFAPVDNTLASAGNAGVAGTASELLSSQLNNLLGGAFDENFTFNVGTTRLNDINLNLRANLLNGRLNIERSGALVGSTNRSVTVGNITARYRLLPNDSIYRANPRAGQLSIEAFNRENLGIFGGSSAGNNSIITTTQGLGVFYRKEFNSFRELITGRDYRRERSSQPQKLGGKLKLNLDSLKTDSLRLDSLKKDSLRRDTTVRNGVQFRQRKRLKGPAPEDGNPASDLPTRAMLPLPTPALSPRED